MSHSAPPVVQGLRAQLGEPGEIERWWLDNPARKNALTPEALRWIARRCEALRGQVVVLAGCDETFCAGFDLQALAASLREDLGALPDTPLIEASEAMHGADATFVAAVERYAIGAGVELSAACDFRVFSDHAWLRIPAGKLGVVYHPGGLRRINAAYGPQICARLLLVGDKVPATELGHSHAVTRLAAPGQVERVALSLAAQISEQDPYAQRHNRRMLRALAQVPMPPPLIAAHEHARRQAYARVRERNDQN